MDILNLQTTSFVERFVAASSKVTKPPPIVAPPVVAEASIFGTVVRVNKYTVKVSASLSNAVNGVIAVFYTVNRRYSGGELIDSFSGNFGVPSGALVGSYTIDNYFSGIVGGEKFSIIITGVSPNPVGGTNINIGGIA
ncbi:hypothetical protein [Mucilaginibacter defluvii]|uniref:Uncharacterized protein n=1 Tax=Mucilaginibacter defluvii TaxID=1196019 RepID=A0ABP9FRY4_9SPHI